MFLGILVALIKIAELANVQADIGMYAMGVLVLLFRSRGARLLPALRRGAFLAAPPFDSVHVGSRDRGGHLLRPRQHTSRTQHNHAWFDR